MTRPRQPRAPDEKLAPLGYTRRWAERGLLPPPDFLEEQLRLFAQGDDKSTEHYRYGAYLHYLRTHKTLTDAELDNYLDVARHDQDMMMASSAMVDLFGQKLSDAQFEKLCLTLKALKDFDAWMQKWIRKIIAQQRLRRTKKAART
ncbi:MAG: hypothetical protein LBS89_08730 [Zoogloeaceae bacterium]|jgi:hypothetical protein|nr:hypothetical protein [Zoogloeaceae bacterium]